MHHRKRVLDSLKQSLDPEHDMAEAEPNPDLTLTLTPIPNLTLALTLIGGRGGGATRRAAQHASLRSQYPDALGFTRAPADQAGRERDLVPREAQLYGGR